jgi:hypothetical protein
MDDNLEADSIANEAYNAGYILCYTQSKGSFNFSFSKRTGIEIQPSFSIRHKRGSLKQFQSIQKFFNCGSVRFLERENSFKYEVKNLTDITEKIIPFFQENELYLYGRKKLDFKIFADICKDMKQNLHLNYEKNY